MSYKFAFYFLFFYFPLIFLITTNCSQQNNKPESIAAVQEYSKEEIEVGEQLAKQYCSGCHIFTTPDKLPKKYWKDHLLIKIGRFLGVKEPGYHFIDDENSIVKARIDSSNLFPASPLVDSLEWRKIKAYYLSRSPTKLEKVKNRKIPSQLDQFDIEKLNWKCVPSGVTMLKVLNDKSMVIGHTTMENKCSLFHIDLGGKQFRKVELNSPAIFSHIMGQKLVTALMGSFLAIDDPTGSIIELDLNHLKHNNNLSVDTVLNILQRPINFNRVDINIDGNNDLLVSEFGKFFGGLHIYNSEDADKRIVVYNGPGSIKSIVKDVNDDGLPDIYLLVAQGDEGIYLFINKGNFQFERKRLLRFPPYYGSTHFDLIDFDHDGDEDILYSNGDSGDFGTPSK